MKRIIGSLVCGALFFTGCGTDSSSSSSDKNAPAAVNTSAESSSQEEASQKESSYDSYITYTCDSSADLNAAAEILESRLKTVAAEYDVIVDDDSREVRFSFDNFSDWAGDFLEDSVKPNAVRFRKGNKQTDEAVIDNTMIADAEFIFIGSENDYAVSIELNSDGARKFASVTAELAGTETPVSIWCDDEMLYAPTIIAPITDGNIMLTGNFGTEKGTQLARKLRFAELPYKVSVKAYSFAAVSGYEEDDTNAGTT